MGPKVLVEVRLVSLLGGWKTEEGPMSASSETPWEGGREEEGGREMKRERERKREREKGERERGERGGREETRER